MSDFLSNLVARTIAQPALVPRTRLRFEAPAVEDAPLVWPETVSATAREVVPPSPGVRAAIPARVEPPPAAIETASHLEEEPQVRRPEETAKNVADDDRPLPERMDRHEARAPIIERVVETSEAPDASVTPPRTTALPHRFDEQPPRVIERQRAREVETVERERVVHTTFDRTRRAIDGRHHAIAAPAPEPVIQVSIGRIEVRAVPAAPPARSAPRNGMMSIDDYVAKRKAKERR